jgi:hypothetical protein
VIILLPLTLEEKLRFSVFENRVLRRIFGPRKEEVTGRLHSEELHNLYVSPDIIRVDRTRRMRWAAHVTRVEETRNVNRILEGKPEGKGYSEGIELYGRIILE